MEVFVEYDAAPLAELIGFRRPACDAMIVRLGAPADVLASVVRHNPLKGQWIWDPDLPGPRVVCWSGTLGDELFGRDPRTWSISGHQALQEFCGRVQPRLKQQGRSLCLRPHSRHVLSDVQSCVTFQMRHAGDGLEIALDATAMLEPAMLRDVDDYVSRAFEALGPRCAMVALRDVRGGADDEACQAAPLGDGLLSRDLVLGLVRDHVPPATPIVIGPEKLQQQLAWLER